MSRRPRDPTVPRAAPRAPAGRGAPAVQAPPSPAQPRPPSAWPPGDLAAGAGPRDPPRRRNRGFLSAASAAQALRRGCGPRLAAEGHSRLGGSASLRSASLGGTAGPAVNSTQRGSMENILNGNLEYAYSKDDGGITQKGWRGARLGGGLAFPLAAGAAQNGSYQPGSLNSNQ